MEWWGSGVFSLRRIFLPFRSPFRLSFAGLFGLLPSWSVWLKFKGFCLFFGGPCLGSCHWHFCHGRNFICFLLLVQFGFVSDPTLLRLFCLYLCWCFGRLLVVWCFFRAILVILYCFCTIFYIFWTLVLYHIILIFVIVVCVCFCLQAFFGP